MDDVGCTGSEASMFSCAHTTNHNCGHHQDAGVQCVTREYVIYTRMLARNMVARPIHTMILYVNVGIFNV